MIDLNKINSDCVYSITDLQQFFNYKTVQSVHNFIKKYNIPVTVFHRKKYIKGSDILKIFNELFNNSVNNN